MDPCILLADRIEAILDRGMQVNQSTCHFIDSTFGCASIKALAAIVRDEGDCERDALLDLLFSPDEAVQMGIEDLLTDYDFQKSDEVKIAAQLVCRNLAPIFNFSGYNQTLKIKMPVFCADLLVIRLKIWKKPDRKLSRALCRFMAKDLQKQAMVRLRNSRFEQTRNRVDFLCSLIEKIADNGRDFWIYFDFMLAFFDELASDGNIYNALRDKKKFYFRHLQKALKYETDLGKSNMETMMLKGLHGPAFNLADIRRKMRTIDRICRICFGRSECFESEGDVLRHNSLGIHDIHSFINMLT
ncbi:MAG: hypothetical protein JRE58_08180 [Deltaproteobacteria bacterium]|nr:hypothetical protein [Deltaproteobacteria bacterium]